ncbi:MAG: hpr [Clostridia bacterium]|nr:hpr [Clostridia bacterium]
MIEVNLILANKLGLHARPAADFTKLAAKFKSKITLVGKGKTVDAKSILMVLTMGIKQGEQLTIIAEGPDEVECIEVLRDFIEKLN